MRVWGGDGVVSLTGSGSEQETKRKPAGTERKKQVPSSSSLESSFNTSYGQSLTGSSWKNRNVVCRVPATAL